MSLVSIIDAYLNNGADKLLEGASFAVEENERICLVGRNGTGKSTLLSLIQGSRELDSGRIIIQNGLKIASLKQDPPAYETGTVYTLAASGVPVVGEALAKFSVSTDPHEQIELSSIIESHDGWVKDGTIKKILKIFYHSFYLFFKSSYSTIYFSYLISNSFMSFNFSSSCTFRK